MGMIKERIRTEEQNQRHRELVEQNRRQKLRKYQQQQEQNRVLFKRNKFIKKIFFSSIIAIK